MKTPLCVCGVCQQECVVKHVSQVQQIMFQRPNTPGRFMVRNLQFRSSSAALPTRQLSSVCVPPFCMPSTYADKNNWVFRWAFEDSQLFFCFSQFSCNNFFRYASPQCICQRMAIQIAFQRNYCVIDIVPFCWMTIAREPYACCGAFRCRKLQQSGSISHFYVYADASCASPAIPGPRLLLLSIWQPMHFVLWTLLCTRSSVLLGMLANSECFSGKDQLMLRSETIFSECELRE